MRAETVGIYHRLTTGFLILTTLSIAMAPGLAHAGTGSPMGDVICFILGVLWGNLGRGLATMAVIIIGLGAILGKTSWGLAITVGIGIAIMFSADWIVLVFTGIRVCV